VSFAPFVATPPSIRVRPDGEPATSNQLVSSLDVTEGYFRAIGIDVVRGRGFDRTDSYGVRTVIVSRELERRVFGGDALGKRLMRSSMNDAYDVVGVVENAKHREFTEDDKAVVYFPDQGFRALPHFLIRSTGDTSHQTLDRAVRAADLRMVVTASWSMATLVARTVAEPTFRARLAGVFAIIALLISAVGSYALASRAVADRRREIAVRVAIGAAPGDVRRLIIGDTLRTIAIGLMLGLPGAYVGSQATRSWLFGVSPTAPHIFAVAAASLAVAAVVATLLPASRAARVDPMLALKN
jgi:hypothetical protein